MIKRKNIYFVLSISFVVIVFSFAHSLLSLTYATSSPLPNIIISKVGYNPTKLDLSEHAYEWFELYNPTQASIDISNWTVAEDQPSRYFVFPEHTSLLSGGHLFVVNNKTEFLKQNSQLQSFSENIIEMTGSFCSTSSGCLLLNNSEDSLTLRNNAPDIGDVVDFVGWENRLDIADASVVWNLEVSDGEFICRENVNDTNLPSDFMAPCTHDISFLLSPLPTLSPTPTPTLAPIIIPVVSLESENHGTGGKNPLVVERLRKAGLTGISYNTIGTAQKEDDRKCNYSDWICAIGR